MRRAKASEEPELEPYSISKEVPWALVASDAGDAGATDPGAGRVASGRDTGWRMRARSLSPGGLMVSVSRIWSA